VLTPFATSVVASLPSPSFNTISLGPVTLRLYGLCIALGVIAAVIISSKRWEARGGNPDDIGTIALWAVPAGVIGARVYHVATDWKKYEGNWGEAFNITHGGLGIPGGILFGVIVGLIVVKKKGLPAAPLLDVVAPAIPVAQAIGRLGNWFNQELYGRPTKLPWGLEITDAVNAKGIPYAAGTLFHPTFLYEALWSLGVAGVLVLIDRTRKLRPGELFAGYVLGYGIGRLWVEDLRIDEASLIWGVRVNIWMSSILILGSLAYIVISRRRPAPTVPREHEAETAEELAEDEAAAEVAAEERAEEAEVAAEIMDAADAADAVEDAPPT
jgi:prolipoprotein diacylglyceryl transferase